MAFQIISELLILQDQLKLEEISISICPEKYKKEYGNTFGLCIKKNGTYYNAFFKVPKQFSDESRYFRNCVKGMERRIKQNV